MPDSRKVLSDMWRSLWGDVKWWPFAEFETDFLDRYPDQPFRSLDDLSRESWGRYGPKGAPYDLVEDAYPIRFSGKTTPGEGKEVDGGENDYLLDDIKFSGKDKASPGKAAAVMKALIESRAEKGGTPADWYAAQMVQGNRMREDLERPRPTMGPGGISMQRDPQSLAMLNQMNQTGIQERGVQVEESLVDARRRMLDAQAYRDMQYGDAMSGGQFGPGSITPAEKTATIKRLYEGGKIDDNEAAQLGLLMGSDFVRAVESILGGGTTMDGVDGGQPSDLVWGVNF